MSSYAQKNRGVKTSVSSSPETPKKREPSEDIGELATLLYQPENINPLQPSNLLRDCYNKYASQAFQVQ